MGDLDKPTLYTWITAPRGLLPQWTADACGFEILVLPIDTAAMRSEDYKQVHANGKCPALVIDTGIVVESTSIIRYMARATGKLYGSGAFEGGQVEQWLQFYQEDLAPL
jgi:glutathione S-transferase